MVQSENVLTSDKIFIVVPINWAKNMTMKFNAKVKRTRIFFSNTDPSIPDIISKYKKRWDLPNHCKQYKGLFTYIKTQPYRCLITGYQFVTRRSYKIGSPC